VEKYTPNPSVYLVFISDLIVFVVAGAYFGTGIYSPTNFVSAIAARLTWPIGLGALVTTDKPSAETGGPVATAASVTGGGS
jgi:hypothetical protein